MGKSSLPLHLFIIIATLFIFSVSMFAAGTFISFITQKKAIDKNIQKDISDSLKIRQYAATLNSEASSSAR